MPFKVQKALSKISGVGAGCGPCQEMEEKKYNGAIKEIWPEGVPKSRLKLR
jgi:hypothetical protein